MTQLPRIPPCVADLIAEARAAGVTLSHAGDGRLKLRSIGPAPADLLERIKAAKVDVLAALAAEKPVPVVAYCEGEQSMKETDANNPTTNLEATPMGRLPPFIRKSAAKSDATAKSDWQYEIATVTPFLASNWLATNDGNRRLRPGVVDRYARAMKDGDWSLTPEPIIIADTGRLLNGQHRLRALVQANVSLRMLVVTNVSEDVFLALDRGQPRSFVDNTGVEKKLAEISRLACSVMSVTSPTDGEQLRVSKILLPGHEILLEATTTTSKVFSAAPVRLSAVATIMSQPDTMEYVCRTYAGLVLNKLSEISPKAQAFAAAVFAGRVCTGATQTQYELASVAHGVFDQSRQHQVRVIKSDADFRALQSDLLKIGIEQALKSL